MKKRLICLLCSIFAFVGLLFVPSQNAFAVPDTDPINPDTTIVAPDDEADTETTDTANTESTTGPVTDAACYDQVGGIGWLICPTTGTLAKGIDAIYGWLENLLIVNPISTDRDSPVYLVWEYIRNITNIVFIIFLLVVIYSQLTGLGISNYGIKSVLPRIIIAAVLVNLSFILCAIAVDLSNILGASLKSVFDNVQASTTVSGGTHVYSAGEIATSVLGGGTGAVAIAGIAYFSGAIFLLVPIIFAGIIAVLTAFIVMAARHALIVLLLIVSPLALVAYLLPNTESWFNKWKDLFLQMLVFYPMFAVLFGASQLASWVIFASATNAAGETSFLGIILGIAVQLLPLFFALSLMKMSNTVLGSISTGIQRLTSPAQQGLDSWARSKAADHRTAKRNAWLEKNSMLTGARAANWLNYRKKLREIDSKNAETTVDARATIRAHKKISGGFDPNKLGEGQTLHANNYTRRAKLASTMSTQATIAETDTSNLLSDYKAHYVPEGRSKDLGRLSVRRISATVDGLYSKTDKRLADESGQAWLHYNRAQFTAKSNEEADYNDLTEKYIDAAFNGYDDPEYKKWLLSSAGALGPKGVTGVMGQILAHANTVEQRQRRDAAITFAKFGWPKRTARDMLVGYLTDDNGYAVDEKGDKLKIKVVDKKTGAEKWEDAEIMPGEILKTHPEMVVRYDKVDEKGEAYFDLKDQKDRFVMRVYKYDKPLIKELLSNLDMPINDPINNLWSILAGIDDDPDRGNNDPLKGIGLSDYSTTIGRSILSAGYKEKLSGMGPMAATSIGKRQIKSSSQLYLEMLSNIEKTGKAGNFLTQDAIHIRYLNLCLDPNNWDRLFPEDELDAYVNVNGDHISGYQLDDQGNAIKDENGKFIKKPLGESSYAEKMAYVREKFIAPYAKKIASLMRRSTPSIADSQKPDTGEALAATLDLLKTNWKQNATSNNLPDIFAKHNDQDDISKGVKELYEGTSPISDMVGNSTTDTSSSHFTPQHLADHILRSSEASTYNTVGGLAAYVSSEFENNNHHDIASLIDDLMRNDPNIDKRTFTTELYHIISQLYPNGIA